ncbi:MAG: membrane protein insertion efficiency factor YidD [Planctomycetota bacterium]
MKLLRRLFVLPIVVYRRWISPWTPPTCRFRPTCSAYAEEAVLTHGIVKGSLLAAWRILRCHPFNDGGHEPVPPRGRWRAEG